MYSQTWGIQFQRSYEIPEELFFDAGAYEWVKGYS